MITYYKLDGTLVRKKLSRFQNYDINHREWFDIGFISMDDVVQMNKNKLTKDEAFLEMI